MNELNVFKRKAYGRNPLEYIKYFGKQLKWAYQRITRGYCDADTWDLDYYYANLIGVTLKHLADNTISYPYDSDPEEWKAYLTDLGNVFLSINNDELLTYEERQKLVEEGFNRIRDNYFDLWD